MFIGAGCVEDIVFHFVVQTADIGFIFFDGDVHGGYRPDNHTELEQQSQDHGKLFFKYPEDSLVFDVVHS